jgi:predicted nucleic acid-binding protein
VRLAIDASILIAELPRTRGQRLIASSSLELIVAEHAWQETLYELPRRLAARERHGQLSAGGAERVLRDCLVLVETKVLIVQTAVYAEFETVARRRVPRDPRDWPTVALALALEAGIWTADADFLGCGVPTWTTETLLLDAEA